MMHDGGKKRKRRKGKTSDVTLKKILYNKGEVMSHDNNIDDTD